MLRVFKRHYILITAILILLVMSAAYFFSSLRENDGHFVYVLDDGYIHMAMAKNFVKYGVWGITKYGFSSTSSSPLWALLLSVVYFIFGVNEIAPFLLNIIFGISVLVICYALCRKESFNSYMTFIILFSVLFFTPLIPVIFCGQEHILHILIAMPFLYFSAEALARENSGKRDLLVLLVLSPLLTTVRYEGLFMLSVVCLLFFVKKKAEEALLLGITGFLPIVAYGFLSISKGWFFLPTSVLLKGSIPDLSSWGSALLFMERGYEKIAKSVHILYLLIFSLVIAVALFKKNRDLWGKRKMLMVI
ncbi:MAG: hypothetical protein JW994_05600, partial [Candidatus Omnitrophica bacterium]|nr:hypothetical protein [Candidatus Omnitrophota bacterium]